MRSISFCHSTTLLPISSVKKPFRTRFSLAVHFFLCFTDMNSGISGHAHVLQFPVSTKKSFAVFRSFSSPSCPFSAAVLKTKTTFSSRPPPAPCLANPPLYMDKKFLTPLYIGYKMVFMLVSSLIGPMNGAAHDYRHCGYFKVRTAWTDFHKEVSTVSN